MSPIAADAKEQEATRELKSAFTRLAVNLIRIVGGQGNPERFLDNIGAFASAANAHALVSGRPADSALLSEMIRFRRSPEDVDLEALIMHGICEEALQAVASTLAEQPLQRRDALREIVASTRLLEDMRMRRRHRRKQIRPAAPLGIKIPRRPRVPGL